MPWCVLPWVQLLWDFLSFLDFLEVYSLCQIGGVLQYFCKYVFNLLLLFLSFWHFYHSDVGKFKVVLEVPKPLLSFFNFCFFILFHLNFYLFPLFQIVDLSPDFLPFSVGSLYIFLYFSLHSLHFFLCFATKLNHFCESVPVLLVCLVHCFFFKV